MTSSEGGDEHEGGEPTRIGEVAAAFGVHPQTLRLYERAGLLRPARTRGNARRFGRSDRVTLARILELTRVEGINLAATRRILELERRVSSLERENEQLRGGTSRHRTSDDGSMLYCRSSDGV